MSLETEVDAWFTARAERRIETAIARVYLEGDVAWKLKRWVSLGYVEFASSENRLWALKRELEFNQATAPGVYRAVRRVTRAADGGLELDGPGALVDHALEMARFDDAKVLAAAPATVDGAVAEELGRTIAGFHAAASLRPQGGIASLRFTVGSNAELLRGMAHKLDGAAVETLLALTDAEVARRTPLLEARTAGGFSRRCHGDLHLGNILLEDDGPVLFDCIEFNDLLSDIDVQYDLAFLLMDLAFRDRADAAVRALSAYLDQAARHFDPADLWAGLAAMPLFLSVRAGVRAHVEAYSDNVQAADAYVRAGIAHLSPASPRLAAVGGLSGSGKSTVARLIAPALGASPGAVILRTDEIRKRLTGAAATEALPPAAYTPAMDAKVYGAMFTDAAALLAAGRAVILDATFLAPAHRAAARDVAAQAGAPFDGLWLEAPAAILAQRIAGRSGDASDADVSVLAAQLARAADVDWPRLDVSGSAQAAAKAWLDRSGICP